MTIFRNAKMQIILQHPPTTRAVTWTWKKWPWMKRWWKKATWRKWKPHPRATNSLKRMQCLACLLGSLPRKPEWRSNTYWFTWFYYRYSHSDATTNWARQPASIRTTSTRRTTGRWTSRIWLQAWLEHFRCGSTSCCHGASAAVLQFASHSSDTWGSASSSSHTHLAAISSWWSPTGAFSSMKRTGGSRLTSLSGQMPAGATRPSAGWFG